MTPEKILENEHKIQELIGTKTIRLVDPNKIYMPSDLIADKDFWAQHGKDKDHYLQFIKKSKTIYDYLDETKSEFQNRYELSQKNRELANMYISLFDSGSAIKLQEIHKDLFFTGDGRHRIFAAKELGVWIPAYIRPLTADASMVKELKMKMQKG